MKHLLTTGIFALISFGVMANGAGLNIDKYPRGTASIDEAQLKELDSPTRTKSGTAKSREKMMENPRNPAMVKGFQNVDKQEQTNEKEKQLNLEPENVMEDETYGEEQQEPVWR